MLSRQIWTNIFPYLHIHSLFSFLNMVFKEKQYSLFAFFSGLQGNFSSMLALKSKTSCRQCFPRGNERPFPKPTGVLPHRMVAVRRQPASCQRLRLWTPKSVRRFASHALKKAGKADGKTEGDKQISEAADTQTYRRGRRKNNPAGQDSRNLRFRVHAAAVLRRQAHHRQNGRPDHPGTTAAWRSAQASFRGGEADRKYEYSRGTGRRLAANPTDYRNPE